MVQQKLCINPCNFYSISHKHFEFPLFKDIPVFWTILSFKAFWFSLRFKHIHHKVVAESWVLSPIPAPPSPKGVIQRETFEGADVLWDPGSHQCPVDWKSVSCIWWNDLKSVCSCCSASSWANGLALTLSALLTQYFNLDFYGTGCRASAAENLRSFLAVKINSVWHTAWKWEHACGRSCLFNLTWTQSHWLNNFPMLCYLCLVEI